jgi:hypothetical protein
MSEDAINASAADRWEQQEMVVPDEEPDTMAEEGAEVLEANPADVAEQRHALPVDDEP